MSQKSTITQEMVKVVDDAHIHISGFNIVEAIGALVAFMVLLSFYLAPRTPDIIAKFNTGFAVFSILYGLIAIAEKSRGKGSWFEVVLAFFVYYGYGAVYGGVKQIPGLDQFTYALTVTAFWVIYNSTGEIEGWMSIPKRLFAGIKSKVKGLLKLPKISLPKLPKLSLPTIPNGKANGKRSAAEVAAVEAKDASAQPLRSDANKPS